MYLFNEEKNTHFVYVSDSAGHSGVGRMVNMMCDVLSYYHKHINVSSPRLQSIVDDRYLSEQDKQDLLNQMTFTSTFADRAELLNSRRRILSGQRLTEAELEIAYKELHRHAVQTHHLYQNDRPTHFLYKLERALIPLAIVCEVTKRLEEAERIHLYLLRANVATYIETRKPYGYRFRCGAILWYVVSLARLQRRQGNIEQTISLLQATVRASPLFVELNSFGVNMTEPSPPYGMLASHANPYWFDGQFAVVTNSLRTLQEKANEHS